VAEEHLFASIEEAFAYIKKTNTLE
jgi:hypothetical protein